MPSQDDKQGTRVVPADDYTPVAPRETFKSGDPRLELFEKTFDDKQVKVTLFGHYPEDGQTLEQYLAELAKRTENVAAFVDGVFSREVLPSLDLAQHRFHSEGYDPSVYPPLLSLAPAEWTAGAQCSLPPAFASLMASADDQVHPLLHVRSYYNGEFILAIWAEGEMTHRGDGTGHMRWEAVGVTDLLEANGAIPCPDNLPHTAFHCALWRYTNQHHQPENTAVPRLVAAAHFDTRANFKAEIARVLDWCFPQSVHVADVVQNFPWVEGLQAHPAHWRKDGLLGDCTRFAFLGIPYGICIDVLPNAVRASLHVIRPRSVDPNEWVDKNLTLQMTDLGMVAEGFSFADVRAACEFIQRTETMQAVKVLLKAQNGSLADLLAPADRDDYEARKALEAEREALKTNLVQTFGLHPDANGNVPPLGPDVDVQVIREGIRIYRGGQWRWCSVSELQNLPGARVRVSKLAGGRDRIYNNVLWALRYSGCAQVIEVGAPSPSSSTPSETTPPISSESPDVPEIQAFRVESSPLANPRTVEGQA